MKLAFVLGFHNAVETELRAKFGEAFQQGVLLWMGSQGWNRPFDIREFRKRLDLAVTHPGDDEVLVVLAEPIRHSETTSLPLDPSINRDQLRTEQQQWVTRAVRGIVLACGPAASERIRLETVANALDSTTVSLLLEKFGVKIRYDEVQETALIGYLAGRKILCVRAGFQTSFKTALERASFPPGSYDRYFSEMIVSPGQNSNLNQELKERVKAYRCMLYAGKGLRHLSRDVTSQQQCEILRGETTADAVSKLKERLLQVSRPSDGGNRPSRR